MKFLLKTWAAIIGGVLLLRGFMYGLTRFFMWYRHPYIPYILGILTFLGITLMGAYIVWGLIGEDDDN